MIRATVRYDKRPAVLTRDLRRDLKRGHPWVFADAVRLPTSARAGDCAVDGEHVAPICAVRGAGGCRTAPS